MWINYLKIAFRQLWKHKMFSALNIFGLATSMSVCLLLIMILMDQYSYDSFHEKGDRIYRVISNRQEKGIPIKRAEYATTALSIAEELKQNYPFVDKAVRVAQINEPFKIDDKTRDTDNSGFAVDADFLEVFDFGWIEGDQRTALQNPRSIVLTQAAVQSLFPDEDPMGKTVEYGELGEFIITGIMPDPPIRSHLQFDYLTSFTMITSLSEEDKGKIGIFSFDDIWRGLVYVMLDERADRNNLDLALTEQATAYSDRNEKDNFLFAAQPLTSVMPSPGLNNEVGIGTPVIVMYFLMILGVIIILAACFNYMNLSVARSLERAKEIGIRKVIGARKSDVALQFLGESVLISLIALIVAVGILEFLIPAFLGLDPFVGQTFTLSKTPAAYLTFFVFSLFIGLLAGIFPAFNIAAFQPIEAIKKLNTAKLFSRVGFRKVLVTMQFAMSLIFVFTVILVLLQQKHVLNADLGARTKNILNVRMQDVDYSTFAQRVQQLPGVADVSSSRVVIMAGENVSTQVRFNNDQDTMSLLYNGVSSNYLENFDIQLIAGKNFPENINSKGEQFIILNEKATKRIGYKSPDEAIGATIAIDSNLLTVIGVVQDFHHGNIWFDPIEPFALRHGGDFARNANIRLNGNNVAETRSAIFAIWNELSPDAPTLAFFTDERVYFMAKFFHMGSRVIGFVGVLTIIITCMGLLGMVIYTIEGRTKEVGIRKILGASEKNIIWQLSKGFFFLFGIAILLAVPIAIFGANLWLQNFLMRITIQPWMLLSGIAVMLVLGLLTVISQTYNAARSNPVESLRSE